jgi:hypothetical protein
MRHDASLGLSTHPTGDIAFHLTLLQRGDGFDLTNSPRRSHHDSFHTFPVGFAGLVQIRFFPTFMAEESNFTCLRSRHGCEDRGWEQTCNVEHRETYPRISHQ